MDKTEFSNRIGFPGLNLKSITHAHDMNEMHNISFKRGFKSNNLLGKYYNCKSEMMRELFYDHTYCVRINRNFQNEEPSGGGRRRDVGRKGWRWQ